MLGNKVGMTQIFLEDGNASPITVIKVGPCTITQIKTLESDGYNAIQIGYKNEKPKNITKPELGHLEAARTTPLKYLKEYRVNTPSEFSLGQAIDISQFDEGQYVDISGKTIGKGFSGNQKRHNFSRGPMTHGSKNHREPGSIGQGSTPGRVYPGKKMSGQHGNKTTTISRLKILKIDKKDNILIVEGSVPGKPGNLLSIKPTSRK